MHSWCNCPCWEEAKSVLTYIMVVPKNLETDWIRIVSDFLNPISDILSLPCSIKVLYEQTRE